jgi:hypothetical protein
LVKFRVSTRCCVWIMKRAGLQVSRPRFESGTF